LRWPWATLRSHLPCWGMDRCRRRLSSSLNSRSLLAPFRDRLPQHPELPGPGLPTDVREAQEFKRLRLAEPPGLPVPGGEPSELDQPGLLGLQLQPEPGETLSRAILYSVFVFRLLLDALVDHQRSNASLRLELLVLRHQLGAWGAVIRRRMQRFCACENQAQLTSGIYLWQGGDPMRSHDAIPTRWVAGGSQKKNTGARIPPNVEPQPAPHPLTRTTSARSTPTLVPKGLDISLSGPWPACI